MNTDVTDPSAPQNSPIWADRKEGLEPQLQVTFGEYICQEKRDKLRGKLVPVTVTAAKRPGVAGPAPAPAPAPHEEQSRRPAGGGLQGAAAAGRRRGP